jgi:hypothetical protein
MSPLAELFHALLREGRVLLRQLPPPDAAAKTEVVEVLRQTYTDHRLEVAGPTIAFDAEIATAAANLVHQACWALVSHALPPEELEKSLVMPGAPQSAAQHLSADLVLRFLPQVLRRARALDPADPLVMILEKVLRQWPLSGVLADIEEGPATPPEFDAHPGLLLLYAERLARHERPAWFPSGPGREYVALVWNELGKDMALLQQAEQVAQGLGGAETGEDVDD